MNTISVTVMQEVKRELSAKAYDESKNIVEVLSEDGKYLIQVYVEEPRVGWKCFGIAKIVKESRAFVRGTSTTNYNKAIGLAVKFALDAE